ncbi:MAG TPA: phenylalanine--tRNA ligase subunit alpha, partial [Blastocatellia bacterium]|nr:phenylalanine--tRNA ligase subunit alpha [Blastocatellia bacterium]
MTTNFDEYRAQFAGEASAIDTRDALKALRDRWLGRKAGLVTEIRKRMGSIPADERAAFGQQFNDLQSH